MNYEKLSAPNQALQRNWPSALCFSWYALWGWSKYNEGSPAKPANPLSAKPLGAKFKSGLSINK
jgi:hypothetical protein